MSMRFWREVIADRYSGGLVGVLLALSFAMQTLLTGWAAAAAMPEPLGVICSASEDGAHHPATGPDQRHECPCSRLCGAGVQAQTALFPPECPELPIRFADRVEIAAERSVGASAGPAVRPYRARAPPPIPDPN